LEPVYRAMYCLHVHPFRPVWAKYRPVHGMVQNGTLRLKLEGAPPQHASDAIQPRDRISLTGRDSRSTMSVLSVVERCRINVET
jgi:hypothetical protein